MWLSELRYLRKFGTRCRDLKKEIKRLQRLREQVRSWLAGNEVIKQRSALNDTKRQIEILMERHKVVERAAKTKAFSNEGIEQRAAREAAEELEAMSDEVREMVEWLGTQTDQIQEQLEGFEAELEKQASAKKKRADTARMQELEGWCERHRLYLEKIELVVDLLKKKQIEPAMVEDVKDDIEYFVEENSDPDFAENEYLFMDFEEVLEKIGTEAGEKEREEREEREREKEREKELEREREEEKKRKEKEAAVAAAKAAKEAEKQKAAREAERAAAKAAAAAAKKEAAAAAAAAATAVPGAAAYQKSAANNAATVASTAAKGPVAATAEKTRQGSAPASPAKTTVNFAAAAATPLSPSSGSAVISGVGGNAPPPGVQGLVAGEGHIGGGPNTTAAGFPPGSGGDPMPTPAGAAAAAAGQGLPVAGAGPARAPVPSGVAPPPLSPAGAAAGGGVGGGGGGGGGPPGTGFATSRPLPAAGPAAMHALDESAIMLEASLQHLPEKPSLSTQRDYKPQTPCAVPTSYPKASLPQFDRPGFYSELDPQTLFFIFYFEQGTMGQCLAARELKRQAWRFHRKYQTWFQRHDEPQVITNDYEQGTYVYFDHENSWYQRKKDKFAFEYRFLEDHDLA
eukprot:UC1_evm2s808